MSTITMPMSYATYPLYDDPNLNQDCIDIPPHSFSQSVGGVEFDPLPYSTSFPVSYTTSPMMTISPPTQPLSIYTTNLENFSSSSLSSAATSTTSSAFYPDLNFAQCGQWTHVDDGYVSGDTSPTLQGLSHDALSHDAFYPMPDQQVLLMDGSSLANLDIGAQLEPTSILGEAPTLVQTTTEQQLQYSIFDQTSQPPEMGALGMPDSSETYIASAGSSPLPAAKSPDFGTRSKSATSRSPSPAQQSYYSTFDNKGAPIKCPHKGCAKAFGRVYNLKTHLKSHVSTKPWECPMCPRSFTRKHDLQRHVRVHTGQKPYVCPCCHKRFARTDALTRHIRVEDSCRLSEEVANYKGRRRYSDLS